MGEIIKDAVKYPFSDWKKILIFGFIIYISYIVSGLAHFTGSIVTIFFILSIIGFLIGFLVSGYELRIIKSSIAGMIELPKFNLWSQMFIDGFKVYIIHLFYLTPILLPLLLFLGSIKGIINPNILNFIDTYLNEVIRTIISGNFYTSTNWDLFYITILYLFLIMPIQYMALANMAKNNNKLSAAFKFNKIFNKISNIGLKNIIIFYIITIIPFMIIVYVEYSHYINSIITFVISFIAAPYFAMYLYRLVGLFYNSM